ncbi:hypothetical protein BD779DRAFT_1474971 [Infundibulicybe gibba]|nr:hypothetical protein BD779DRAFT_1474971 [Infundibulicybe gibba]
MWVSVSQAIEVRVEMTDKRVVQQMGGTWVGFSPRIDTALQDVRASEAQGWRRGGGWMVVMDRVASDLRAWAASWSEERDDERLHHCESGKTTSPFELGLKSSHVSGVLHCHPDATTIDTNVALAGNGHPTTLIIPHILPSLASIFSNAIPSVHPAYPAQQLGSRGYPRGFPYVPSLALLTRPTQESRAFGMSDTLYTPAHRGPSWPPSHNCAFAPHAPPLPQSSWLLAQTDQQQRFLRTPHTTAPRVQTAHVHTCLKLEATGGRIRVGTIARVGAKAQHEYEYPASTCPNTCGSESSILTLQVLVASTC